MKNPQKLDFYDRNRRNQVLWLTVSGAIVGAIGVAGMIYLYYTTNAIR